jgi:hypothetical protein
MKLTLIAILFLFSTPDEIVNYRKLTREDFKGQPVPGWTGFSTTKIIYGPYRFQGGFEGSDSSVFKRWFKAKAVFIRDKSFMLEKTSWNLEHEQIHFDITELFARKLNTRFQRSFDYTYKQREIPKRLYDSAVAVMNQMHKLFDIESENSENVEGQALWRIRLDAMLRQHPHETTNNYFWEWDK